MSDSLSPAGPDLSSSTPVIHWIESRVDCSARWRSERIGPPPKRVILTDDTITADRAYRLACEGTALLWSGDFHNATQLLQAIARRADKTPARKQRKVPKGAALPAASAETFHQYRQAQSQRARILGALLIPFNADYSIALGRAPDAREACAQAWGPADAVGPSVASLRELQGIIGAYEWRKKGVEIPALGSAPNNRIHPHYGVFSPVRGEYVDMVATASLPEAGQAKFVAFDVGTGTGVLAAVLARRGIETVVATDRDPRALACARENLARLGVADQVTVVDADLFPEGRASLIVCNPPWLPARPGSPLESAIYDEDSRMLIGFLGGLAAHLAPGGEGWLILSDFAEHLGLRTRAELLAAFERGGLQVIGRIDVKPRHPKAADATDPLHAARAAEVTSLWRLAAITS
jgi:SAM-dependent methyltransferase